MEWNRSKTIALASMKCQLCLGMGLSKGQQVCDCVTRRIFGECYGRFKDCSDKDRPHPVAVNLERLGKHTSKALNRTTFGCKTEEYIADFYLIAKRTLPEDEWNIFRFRYLLGATMEQCQRRLRIGKEDLQDACKRIEVAVGRAFGETEPFALYPLDEYFSPPSIGGPRCVPFPAKAARYHPLRPPLAA